jgi:hypothetical protein
MATPRARAELPRHQSAECSLFITPDEFLVSQTYEWIEENRLFFEPMWVAIRNWVASNVQYEEDPGGEYWKLPCETIRDGRGDCEDYAILLCSLLRHSGYDAESVYVIVGHSEVGGHAWVKCEVEVLGWRYFEPQANGLFNMFVADLFSLNEYEETWEFNDVYAQEIH